MVETESPCELPALHEQCIYVQESSHHHHHVDVHLVHRARRGRVQPNTNLARPVGDGQAGHGADIAAQDAVGLVGNLPRQVPNLLQLLGQDLGVLDPDHGPVGRLGPGEEEVVARVICHAGGHDGVLRVDCREALLRGIRDAGGSVGRGRLTVPSAQLAPERACLWGRGTWKEGTHCCEIAVVCHGGLDRLSLPSTSRRSRGPRRSS